MNDALIKELFIKELKKQVSKLSNAIENMESGKSIYFSSESSNHHVESCFKWNDILDMVNEENGIYIDDVISKSVFIFLKDALEDIFLVDRM